MAEKATISNALAMAVQRHQAGRLSEAEALYRQILHAHPEATDALHLLGVIAHQAGRHAIAVDYISRAIKANPNAAEYHNNIAAAYQAAGKKDDALAHYRRALTLKPDYADARSNLGVLIAEEDRHDEAIALFQTAIALDRNDFKAHYHLGKALMEQGRPEEARRSYLRALALRPAEPAAVNDYAIALLQTGDVTALASFVDELRTQTPSGGNQAQMEALPVCVAIAHYLRGDFGACKKYLSGCTIDMSSPSDFPNRRVLATFRNYLSELLRIHDEQPLLYAQSSNINAECYVVGDSHCLSPAWTTVAVAGRRYRVVPRMVVGCKAWHIAKVGSSRFKQWFLDALDSLPAGSNVICTFGEIDCRINEGILPLHKANPQQDLSSIIGETVRQYVACVVDETVKKGIRLCLQGVPAPHRDVIVRSGEDGAILIDTIREFNRVMISAASSLGIPVIDVYRMTSAPDGISNGLYHLDWYHLRPEYLQTALDGYLTGASTSWGSL